MSSSSLNEDEKESDTEALLSPVQELEDNRVLRSRITKVEDYIEEQKQQKRKENEEQEEQERHHILYDTKTIHMYAVAATVNTDINSALPWLFAFTSLFLLASLQSAPLYLSTFETFQRSCSTHSDCRIGQYCDWNPEVFYSATCKDCFYSYEDAWYSNCPSIINTAETGDDIDQTVLWFDRSYKANYNISKYGKRGEEGFWCLAWHHCEQTEMYEQTDEKDNRCDYVSLIANKFTRTRKFVYVMAMTILAFYLSKDIEEAAVEEAVLDHHLASINEDEGLTLKYLPAFFLRLSLRYRRNVLSWMIAITVIGVSLAEDLSVLNIMLNVLAILFIAEADSTIAYLILSPGCKKRYCSPKQLVEAANKAKIKFSFWGTRLTAAFPVIAIILSVFWIEKIINYWNTFHDDIGCIGLHVHLWKVGVEIGPFITGVIHSFCIIYKEFLLVHSEWRKDIESFHEMFQYQIFKRHLKPLRFVIIHFVFEMASNLFVWALNAFLMDCVDLTVSKYYQYDWHDREMITYAILTLGLFSVISLLLICSKTRTQLWNHNRWMADSAEDTAGRSVC